MKLEDINFADADVELLNGLLLIDGSAWAVDQASARRNGKLLTIDFRDLEKPLVRLDELNPVFDRDPHQFFMMRYSRLHEDDQRKILIAKAIPLDGASPRQKEQFASPLYALNFLLQKQEQIGLPKELQIGSTPPVPLDTQH